MDYCHGFRSRFFIKGLPGEGLCGAVWGNPFLAPAFGMKRNTEKETVNDATPTARAAIPVRAGAR